MSLPDIPAFLRIPQDERKAAWDKHRKANPLPPEVKKILPPLGDPEDVEIDADSE